MLISSAAITSCPMAICQNIRMRVSRCEGGPSAWSIVGPVHRLLLGVNRPNTTEPFDCFEELWMIASTTWTYCENQCSCDMNHPPAPRRGTSFTCSFFLQYLIIIYLTFLPSRLRRRRPSAAWWVGAAAWWPSRGSMSGNRTKRGKDSPTISTMKTTDLCWRVEMRGSFSDSAQTTRTCWGYYLACD